MPPPSHPELTLPTQPSNNRKAGQRKTGFSCTKQVTAHKHKARQYSDAATLHLADMGQ